MNEKEFGLRVSSLRAQKNVSAREMSLSIGQNESYINRIENGKCFPSMQAFLYICDYFGITPQEFFDVTNPAPVQVNSILTQVKKMNAQEIDALLLLLKQWN